MATPSPSIPMTPKTAYFHTNHRGDILSVTNANQQRVASYKYGPWGELLSESGSFKQPFRYAGYYFDEETSLYYLKARYYSPELGRFLTKDTFQGLNEDPRTLNLYAYANGNPVMYVDPDGHAPVAFSCLRRFVPNKDITIAFMQLLHYHVMFARKAPKAPHAKAVWFAMMVKSKGPWDLKKYLPFRARYYFRGQRINRSDIGNIHYGFVGASLGYSLKTLLLGGGAASLMDNKMKAVKKWSRSLFDDPRDQAMIKWGFRLYRSN